MATQQTCVCFDVMALSDTSSVFSDNPSILSWSSNCSTEGPEHETFWSNEHNDMMIRIYIEYEGSRALHYVPSSGKVSDFFDTFQEDVDPINILLMRGDSKIWFYDIDGEKSWSDLECEEGEILVVKVCDSSDADDDTVIIFINHDGSEEEHRVHLDQFLREFFYDFAIENDIHLSDLELHDDDKLLWSLGELDDTTWGDLMLDNGDTFFVLDKSIVRAEEEEPVNYIEFQEHKLPLFPSDIDRPVFCVVNEAIRRLNLPHNVYFRNFVLDVCGGYELTYGDVFRDGEFLMSRHLHRLDRDTFNLTYYPNFEVYLVLVCDERRRIRAEFCAKHLVEDVKQYLVDDNGMDFDEIRLFHKGNELLEDYEKLEEVFDLANSTADPYALYELEVMARARGGGKTSNAKEKSLVKQLKVKQTKKEEYKQVCEDINKNNAGASTTCDVVKTAHTFAKHFASIPDEQSYKVINGAINDNAMTIERLNEMMDVLDPKSRRFNGAETKVESIVKLMLSGQVSRLNEHEQLVQETRKSLVLNLMRHCINLTAKGGNMDTKPLREMISNRIQSLKATDDDAQMEELTNLFEKASV